MRLKVIYKDNLTYLFGLFLSLVLVLNTKATIAQVDSLEQSKSRIDVESGQNIQNYTPAVLLRIGQWEIKSFHNLYSQQAVFRSNAKTSSTNSRSTYYTGINQFLIGLSSKWNAGFDFWHKSVKIDPSSGSRFSLFEFGSDENERTALLYAGPKVKIAPFNKIPKLSVELSYLIPLEKDFEGRLNNSDLFLEADRSLLINNIYFDQRLREDVQLFLRLSQWVSFPRNSFTDNTYLETPTGFFLTYFATSRLSVYTQQEAWIRHISQAFSSGFLQSGLGVKYQLIEGHLELEALYTKFVYGSNGEGAGSTINFGIRFLK